MIDNVMAQSYPYDKISALVVSEFISDPHYSVLDGNPSGNIDGVPMLLSALRLVEALAALAPTALLWLKKLGHLELLLHEKRMTILITMIPSLRNFLKEIGMYLYYKNYDVAPPEAPHKVCPP
ncbi:hypothetical protein Salat_1127200 [Sesamum alatum]|uniref:Uncharacterized protein n=1 Tax=Sesamum alatum TaxID=300844 RepID=A0AAE1YDH9_9LAMI|nr:hypothetical protein Salat_1127200 [Sesamum alatum]